MKKNRANSPLISLVGREIGALRSIHAALLRTYGQRIQSHIEELQKAVEKLEAKPPKAKDLKTQDLRDMLMLIRQVEVKPEKGKRRDLKRIESLVEDLQAFVRDWALP